MRQQGSICRCALRKTGRWTLLLASLLLGNLAQAATDYTFSPASAVLGNLPAGCSLNFLSLSSYSCGVLTLIEGDTITLGGLFRPVTITFSGAFTTGASNLINASGAVDDLNLVTNGVLSLGANTVLNANVVGTAAVNLGSASTLTGNLSTSTPTGIVTLAADSQVGGFIRSQEGAISLGVRSTVGGAVSAGAGVVTLDEDVRVGGAISTGAGAVTVGGRSTVGGGISTGAGVVTLLASATLGGGITTQDGGITVGNQSSVGGAITSTRAGIVTLGSAVKVAAGISTQAGAINIGADSEIGGSVSTQAGVVTLTTGITVKGDISTVAGGITVGNSSRVCGSIGSTGAGVVILTQDIKVGGSVTTQVGAITIGIGSTIGGDVKSGGVVTLVGLLIGGNVRTGAGAITLTSSRVRGTVTSSNGGVVTATGSVIGDSSLVIPAACAGAAAGDIDHFEFSYAANALTCNPQPITVRACLDASCSSLFVDVVSLTLSPSSGWSAITPAAFSGANTLLFSGGSAMLKLRSSNVGGLSLVVAGAAPAAQNGVVCSTSGCTLNYADSGFIFDVPNLMAAKPQANIVLSAVKKDDSSQACVPSFASVTRSLNFTSAYQNPVTGTEPVWVNGSAVTSTPMALSLDFDSSGRAALAVRYDDAGQMQLTARYSGSADTDDSGLLMTGADLFVSKPYGLLLQTDASCSAAGVSASCPVFPGGVRAGDPFSLRIKAVAWQSDGEPRTATALADNSVTPNFQLNDIALSNALVAPDLGSAGTMLPASHNQLLGTQTTTAASISEVGVFTLSATPLIAGYFGETVGGGESALVGRFIPAYLDVVGSASLTPSCGPFSYQGQPMGFAAGQEPSLRVSGHNRAGGVTTNYDRGDFWRLNAPQRSQYTSVTGVASLDKGKVLGPPIVPARLQEVDITQSEYLDDLATEGNGTRVARWSDQQLWYLPAVTPTTDDRLFQALISLNVSAAALRDADLACYTDGNKDSGAACADYFADADPLTVREPGFGGSEVRLGRLRIGNAHGSELQALNLPLSIETWQATATGSGFVLENKDVCSAGVLGDPVLDGFSGQLAMGETTANVVSLSEGVGQLGFTAPGAGNSGSVRVHFAGGPSPALPPTWLDYDWNGAGREAARGIATFGIYSAPTPLIFRRELYR